MENLPPAIAGELNNGIREALRFPRFFEVETVNACNARCNMCTIRSWKKRDSYLMPEAVWKRFLSEIKDHACRINRVNVSRDGEPLLDAGLEKKIAGLKRISIGYVTFATNASLLTPERAVALLDSGLDDIMFSIDGLTKETFEKIRVGLKFEEVVDNCLNFIRLRDAGHYKATVRVRMVLQDQNLGELEVWMRHWKKFVRKGDRVYAKPAHSWGNQLEGYAGITSKLRKGDYSGKPCISPWSTMVVKLNGDIPLCPMDYRASMWMGNIREGGISGIWGSPGFNRARELLAARKRDDIPLCKNCYLWDRDTVIEEGAE